MANVKWRFYKDLLDSNENNIDHIFSAIKKLEVQLRACYSENLDYIESQEFVMLMVRDGWFLIKLMRLFAHSHKVTGNDHNDPIFSTRWLVPNLRRDVLLFENQLPWIVLEKLYELSGLDKNKEEEEEEEEDSLIYLALNFCNPLLPRQKKFLHKYINSKPKPDHLLGLFRDSFIPHFETPPPHHHHENADNKLATAGHNVDEEQQQSLDMELITISKRQKPFEEDPPEFIYCVTELEESGVKFKKRNNYYDLLNISFKKNGVLEIPPLLIDDNTGLVLLNFLAYEQCKASLKPYFTHYVSFFDNLVNTVKDVEILHYKSIINHSLGSDEEVAELFNKLCKGIVHEVDNGNYLYEDLKAINKHCDTDWNKWKAELKHVYFRSPWTVFSIIVAIFLLILTVLQTIYTVVPFYQNG